MTTTIHIRVPAALKKAAQKVAEANGLDLSSVIRMYLTHMEIRGTIPTPLLTVNGFTEEEEEEILQRSREEGAIEIPDLKDYFKRFKQ